MKLEPIYIKERKKIERKYSNRDEKKPWTYQMDKTESRYYNTVHMTTRKGKKQEDKKWRLNPNFPLFFEYEKRFSHSN